MQNSDQNVIDQYEINLLEYLYALLRNKWLIGGLSIIGFIMGFIIAKTMGPVYIGDTVISPKETETQNTPNLSGLGLFGSVVANQLNISGNVNLDKIDIILNSRSFNAELVKKKNLLPMIYSEHWDSINNKWHDDFIVPSLISVGGYIRGSFFNTEKKVNGTMVLSVKSKDSLFSHNLVSAYVEYLDEYIRKDAQQEAKENRDYLEKQLMGVNDPLIQIKIQELIANEVEKTMVLSKEAFKTIDPVFVHKSFKEKKLFPIMFFFVFFLFSSLLIIIKQALISGPKSEKDKKLLIDIRREIFKIPFVK